MKPSFKIDLPKFERRMASFVGAGTNSEFVDREELKMAAYDIAEMQGIILQVEQIADWIENSFDDGPIDCFESTSAMLGTLDHWDHHANSLRPWIRRLRDHVSELPEVKSKFGFDEEPEVDLE